MQTADGVLGGSYHNRQTDQTHDGISYQDRGAEMIFITNPCRRIHDNGSKDVWWCNQALGLCNAEAHAL